MRIDRKYLTWAGIAGTLGVVSWIAMRDRPLDVDGGIVRRGPLQAVVAAEGKTRVRDRYVLTAPVAGRLERIDATEGARVRAGAVVARIAPLPLDAQTLRQAEARVESARSLERDAGTRVRQARATLTQERRTADRIARLVAAGALADRDGEEAALTVRLREEDLASAEARERAAAADVQQARAALTAVGGATSAIVAVRAPADGYVLRIPERSERIVAAGTPIVELGDPGALELVIDVLSSDAARVRPGATVLIDRWGDDEQALTGRVRTIEPAAFTRLSALGIEEQRVNVVIDLPHWPAELSDGYRVEARIVVWEQAGVTIVPLSALFRHDSDWAVFVIRDGRAELRRVRIGERGEAGAQVLDGLAVGDQVVLFPSDQMTTGRRVTPAR